ncbi:uncharacterized protein [Ptychodera flava]
MTALNAKEAFQFICVNEMLPLDRKKRYESIRTLKLNGLPTRAVLYTYSPGGNISNQHFIWKEPADTPSETVKSKTAQLTIEIEKEAPKYHTRQMRREFSDKVSTLAKVKPMHLRELYRLLTNDSAAPSTQQEAERDQRVQMMVELGDPKIFCDLRTHNPGRPPMYEKFWEVTAQYINNVAETAVHERRHESVTYMAAAMSVRHLRDEVTKRCPENTPAPSKQWLRLQFWPKNPYTRSAVQHTGKLEVKYMVQQRQLRKPHIDSHYASAYFHYLKEMAIKFRDYVSFLCLDDKHKVKVGEPGVPVAAVERGKQVLVGLNTSFEVADHDFTKMTLTPSVALMVDVPRFITDSFYRGRVFVGIKCSTFEASSPQRHATELNKVLRTLDDDAPMKLMYSDGGPDHRVTYSSVQLSLISMFLKDDLDAIIAVRTPPGHSWKNPAERIMSILNLGLQAVGVMRKEMSDESEKLLQKCNSMKDVREMAKKNPQLKEDIKDSIQQPVSLISSIVQNLQLKEEKFSVFTSASDEEIDQLLDQLHQIDDSLSIKMTKKQVLQSENMKEFYDKHVMERHYVFSVMKCSDSDCKFHKAPRLPNDVFTGLHHLPDPVLDDSGMHYKPFAEVYGTVTTEKDRPSLQSNTSTTKGHGLPFSPSAQTACRVKRTVMCHECDKPRVLHGTNKLKQHELNQLDAAMEEVDFTCGTDIHNFIPEGQPGHIISKVYVRHDLQCTSPVEIPYFSSSVFPALCSHCGSGEDLLSGERAADIYPTCTDCYDTNQSG